jgi:diaminopimelate epimerase
MSEISTILSFYKYQGCGNDFILIDDRLGQWHPLMSPELVSSLCDRHFGIGADGLILVTHNMDDIFYMVYYNADGQESTFCGNGGRCFAAFLHHLDLAKDKVIFKAKDGMHEARIESDHTITLSMQNPVFIDTKENYVHVLTGSPHVVIKKPQPIGADIVFHEGRTIRYDPMYEPGGVNANFVWLEQGDYFVRTYERGVENETLSCGTGACAAAVSLAIWEQKEGQVEYVLNTQGGLLKVSFKSLGGEMVDVKLNGKAEMVFQGTKMLQIQH